MKAYLCSIGEKTTGIVKKELEKYGFDVVLLDEKEPWFEKYKKFIKIADNDCLRIDADIIPNGNIIYAKDIFRINPIASLKCIVQFKRYDFYMNDVFSGGPLVYSKRALDCIKENIDKISEDRPEVSACRLGKIQEMGVFGDCPLVVGMHGFFQTKDDMERHRKNKQNRGQIERYNFQLAEKLLNL